jgi:hypothetical protein
MMMVGFHNTSEKERERDIEGGKEGRKERNGMDGRKAFNLLRSNLRLL